MNELNLTNPDFLARFRVTIFYRETHRLDIGIVDKEEIIWRGKKIKMNRIGNLDDELQIWEVPFLIKTYYVKTIQDLESISKKEDLFNDE
jgi:hypothetical protein